MLILITSVTSSFLSNNGYMSDMSMFILGAYNNR